MRSNARLAAALPCAGLLAWAALAAPASAAPPKLVGKPSQGASPATQSWKRATDAIERTARFDRSGNKVSATGWISRIEDVEGASTPYLLHTADGRTVRLVVPRKVDVKFSGKAAGDDELETGHVVRLDGSGGGTITASSLTVSTRLDLPALRAIEQAADREIQRRSVLVVPINFPEDRSTPVSVSTLQNEFFGTAATTRSVANFYDRSSRGRMTITGAVSEWLALDTTRTQCGFEAWGVEAEQKLRARGIEPDDYDQVSFVPAWQPAASTECDEFFGGAFNGVSWGPRINLTWANINDTVFRTGTAAHEIGHSFGLAHSNSRSCEHAAEPVPLNDERCAEDDNGGDVDVMGGSGTFRTLQAYQRAKLGLLPAERIADISADGTTQVLTREAEGNTLGTGKQALRLRRKSAPSEVQDSYYYLEYRRPVAPFDRYAPGDPSVGGGVTVSVATDYRGDAGAGWARVSPVRISPSAGPRTFGSAKQYRTTSDGIPENGDTVLRAGDSLYDPIENVTITVVSISASQADIKVTPGTPVNEQETLVYVSSGQLFVYSLWSGRRSRVSVTAVGTRFVVSDYGAPVTASDGCSQLTDYSVTCERTSVFGSYIALGDGDDSLYIGKGVPGNTRVRPGTGDDSVIAEEQTSIQYVAESGADGRDSLAINGKLQLDYSLRSAGINLVAPSDNQPIRVTGEDDYVHNEPPIEYFGNIIPGTYRATDLTVVGTSGADTLNVQATRPTVIDGGPGVDTITAGGAATTAISSDGATDAGVTCSSGAQLVRDAGDAASGCGTPLTGPQARITGAAEQPNEWTTVGPLSFTSSSTVAGLGYRCKWTAQSNPAGGAWTPCTTGWVPPITANGVYRLSVQATVNGAPTGIEQSRNVRRTTSYLSTPTVTLGPVDPVRRVAQVGFGSGFLDTTLECSVAGGVWTPCGSADAVAVRLASTASQLRIRTVTPAGVPDPTPEVINLPAVPEQPKVYLKGGPNAGTVLTTTSTSLDFAADLTGSTFQCRLDGGAWAACTAPKALTGLSNGDHVFEVQAIKAGVSGPIVSRSFTVRAVTPITTVTAAAAASGVVNLTTGTKSWVHWNGVAPSNVVRSVGQQRVSTWSPIGSPATFVRGFGTVSWTNALVNTVGGASQSGSSATGVGFRGNNTGLRLTVPASSAETGTLKLYLGLRGTATRASVRASWADGAVTQAALTGLVDYSLNRYVVTIAYRPSKPSDRLTVDLVQTAGTAASPTEVALAAATVS